jgi:SET domain-containing protein
MKAARKKFSVKKSKSGLGLFANTEFKRGDRIVKYTGEHISHEEADKRGGKYLFIIDKKTCIDGKLRTNIARYINHSCKPNAETEVDEEKQKVFVLARKKIVPGVEITYDYGKEYWEEYIKPYGCKCNACLQKHLR